MTADTHDLDFEYKHVVIDSDGIYLDGIKLDGLKLRPGVTINRSPNMVCSTVTLTVNAAEVFVTEAAKRLESASITEVHGG